MKTVVVSVLMMLSVATFGQTVNKNISLAGEELAKYHKKQKASYYFAGAGLGLIALSTTVDGAKPLVILGLIPLSASVGIRIESLSNLRKSAKALFNSNK